MPLDSPQIQYLIREHLCEPHHPDYIRDRTTGFLQPGSQLHLRWNSNAGAVFVDGAHLKHKLELGDEVIINNKAPELRLVEPLHMTDDIAEGGG